MKLTKLTFFLGCLVGGMGSAMLPMLLDALQTTANAETRQLPFQGRLTDAAGAVIADGAKVVEFKMYDAPTGGSAKWAGEVHKLSINGGLVNTILGGKASLGSVDFASPTFLQITVDADGDGQITAADPPLLPRQAVVAAVYASESGNARNSVKLAGADWSAIMVTEEGAAVNDATQGYIKGAKLQNGGVTATQLADGSVSAVKISQSAVTNDKIADGTIIQADLSTGLRTAVNPPGTIITFAGSIGADNEGLMEPVAGYLLCNGAVIDSTTANGKYSTLKTALETAWGNGNGDSNPNTVNLPDLRGIFLRGWSGMAYGPFADPDKNDRGSRYMGANTGNQVGSFQLHQFQSHNHQLLGERWLQFNVGGTGVMNDGPSVAKNAVTNPPTSYAGGNETRPNNASVVYLIKY